MPGNRDHIEFWYKYIILSDIIWGKTMSYNNIAELFINTTENFASKKLYYYKTGTEWIGVTGTDIREEVENLASGLKSLGLEKGDKVAIQSTEGKS